MAARKRKHKAAGAANLSSQLQSRPRVVVKMGKVGSRAQCQFRIDLHGGDVTARTNDMSDDGCVIAEAAAHVEYTFGSVQL